MIEKLQQSLNFTNSEGEVITFFDGKVTISQVLMFLIVLVAVVLVLKFIKGIVKTIIVVGLAVYLCIYFGIVSPTQVKDIGNQLLADGKAAYEKIVKASDNLKFENGEDGNFTIKIRVEGEWHDISDIKSFVNTKDGLSVKIGDDTIAIKDKDVVELIKKFS